MTHLHDKNMPPVVGLHFDELDHFVIYDYDVHWIDISRCWLDGDRPVEVRASDYRVPGQPDNARNPWGANVEIRYASGANVLIRTVGDARTARGGAPFWIHGTEGTIRGSVLLGSDFLELDRDGEVTPFELEGAWYPEGLAGTMAELLSAIAEDREPYNSARHNLLSLELTLAACRSADLRRRAGGAVTRLPGVMTDVLPSADDGELFRRAKRLGFAGVEVILEASRGATGSTGCGARRPRRGSPFRASCSASTATSAASPTPSRPSRRPPSADVERALDWAAELGSDALLVPFFGRAELRDAADVDRAAAALRPLCRRAAERGVSLLYEGTLASDGDPRASPPASTRRRSAATSTRPTSSRARWTRRPSCAASATSSGGCT